MYLKKYYSILVAVILASLSLTLTSCSDDDEDEDAPSMTSSLVGKWICTDASISSPFETEGLLGKGDYMEFYENGTCKWSEQGFVITAKYKYQNNKISISDISDGSLPLTYDVKRLSDKELVLFVDITILQATLTFSRAS